MVLSFQEFMTQIHDLYELLCLPVPPDEARQSGHEFSEAWPLPHSERTVCLVLPPPFCVIYYAVSRAPRSAWHLAPFSFLNVLAEDSVFLRGASFVLSSFDFLLSSLFSLLRQKQRNFKWANSWLTKMVLSISWWVISSIRHPAWVHFLPLI